MKTVVVLVTAIYSCIVGFVAMLISYMMPAKSHCDHSGYQSFVVQKPSRVSVSSKFGRWLSMLLHSPTVAV